MYTCKRAVGFLILTFIIILATSCASVPKEVVELSYVTGKDLQSIYKSYDTLIHQYYEQLRAERREYLDDVWFPRFLENWRDDGELVLIAKGERIWSDEADSLINTPAGTDPKESLYTLNDWVSYALYAYEVKETELLKSLNDDEERLRNDVQQGFEKVMIANATITAHLNSLRKVQEVQDEVLESLDLKDFRDKINEELINASKKAKAGLDKIQSADARVDNLKSQIDSLINPK